MSIVWQMKFIIVLSCIFSQTLTLMVALCKFLEPSRLFIKVSFCDDLYGQILVLTKKLSSMYDFCDCDYLSFTYFPQTTFASRFLILLCFVLIFFLLVSSSPSLYWFKLEITKFFVFLINFVIFIYGLRHHFSFINSQKVVQFCLGCLFVMHQQLYRRMKWLHSLKIRKRLASVHTTCL